MGLLKKIFVSLNTTNSVPQNTTPLTNYGSAYKATLEELDKTLADSDKALNEMWKADEQYEKDGDISKRILVYEKHLKQKPKWNNFNQCPSLAKMYEKAGRNNDASDGNISAYISSHASHGIRSASMTHSSSGSSCIPQD